MLGDIMGVYNIFLDRLPKIDLHGYDRDMARVMVNDFVDEAIAMGYSEILIINVIGDGIVKESVLDTLSRRKDIINYHVCGENVGCTIVKIK